MGKKWFSNEIKEAANTRDEAYKKALYDNTEESWLQFKIKRNVVVKLLRRKRKNTIKKKQITINIIQQICGKR